MPTPQRAPLPAGPRRLGRRACTAARSAVSGALWAAALTLLLTHVAGAWELGVGRSNRPGNIDLSLGDRGWAVEYIDEGGQPDGIANRNRILDADVRLQGGAGLSWFVQAGLSSARWSRNGSANGRRAPRGFEGCNLGGGLQWRLVPGWSLRLQALWLHYPQSSQPGAETFEYTSLAVVRSW